MVDDAISEEVRRLILENIDSVAQLETLLLLCRHREAWTPEEVAKRIYIDPATALTVLESLTRRGFCAASREDVVRFRYSPRTAERERLVEQLAEGYRTRLIPITTLIHSKSGGVRRFADAFRLREET
jgi:hypothetical protein